MWKDTAKLIYLKEVEDTDGFNVLQEDQTYEVFVNKKSVKRAEFYAAMQAGMKPSIVFEIKSIEFESTKHLVEDKAVYAQKVEFDGYKYDIIRTYSEKEEITELVCG